VKVGTFLNSSRYPGCEIGHYWCSDTESWRQVESCILLYHFCRCVPSHICLYSEELYVGICRYIMHMHLC